MFQQFVVWRSPECCWTVCVSAPLLKVPLLSGPLLSESLVSDPFLSGPLLFLDVIVEMKILFGEVSSFSFMCG